MEIDNEEPLSFCVIIDIDFVVFGGERNEESTFYNLVVNTWRLRKCK